jgi:hypothetical protein
MERQTDIKKDRQTLKLTNQYIRRQRDTEMNGERERHKKKIKI